MGHRPVEVKASVMNGGVCFRGNFILLKLAVLNGTNRPLDGVNVQIIYNDTYKAKTDTVTVKKSVVAGTADPSTTDEAGKVCEGINSQGFYVQSLMIDIPSNVPTSVESSLVCRFSLPSSQL